MEADNGKLVSMWVEENYNCYDAEGILANYGARSRKRWGHGINNGAVFMKDFHAEFFLPESELKIEAENWYNFLTKKENFDKVLAEIASSSAEMARMIKKIVKIDLSRMSGEELFDLYDFYGMNLGKLFNCYMVTQPHRLAKLEKKLKEFLEDRNLDVNKYFSVLTSHSSKIRYSNIGSKFFNGSFAELLKAEDKEIDRTLANETLYSEEILENSEKKKLIEELEPSEEIIRVIEALSILGHERFKMRFAWMPAVYFGELFLIELKRRYDVNKAELRAYDEQEMVELIKTGKKLARDRADLRGKGFLKVVKENGMETHEGEAAREVLDSLLGRQEMVSELKGMVASKGHVVGEVIILSYKKSDEHTRKISGMKEGQIIITEMTRPNIIVACQRAGAIVTDEGGITCHAAIVARELGKPCVIGTKRATSAFRDGDLIEVDAERGIVRKINREEYEKLKLELGGKD